LVLRHEGYRYRVGNEMDPLASYPRENTMVSSKGIGPFLVLSRCRLWCRMCQRVITCDRLVMCGVFSFCGAAVCPNCWPRFPVELTSTASLFSAVTLRAPQPLFTTARVVPTTGFNDAITANRNNGADKTNEHHQQVGFFPRRLIRITKGTMPQTTRCSSLHEEK
jgi:hypothetical protein